MTSRGKLQTGDFSRVKDEAISLLTEILPQDDVVDEGGIEFCKTL